MLGKENEVSDGYIGLFLTSIPPKSEKNLAELEVKLSNYEKLQLHAFSKQN